MGEKSDLSDLQRFSTNLLWHFTGYNKTEKKAFDILKLILAEKKVRIGKFNPEFIMPNGQKRYGFKCICMCDIPFKDLLIHTMRYGKYGIAFDKKKAINSGKFNPIMYVHKKHQILIDIQNKIVPSLDTLTKTNKEHGEKLKKYLFFLGSYLKASDLTSELLENPTIDESQDNNFYYEREWRSIVDWNFDIEDVEAIMIQKKDINEISRFIKDIDLPSLPIITYEMIKKA